MRVVLWTGLMLAFPGILYAAAQFVYPGLRPLERRSVTRALGVASILFIGGVTLGYFMVLPVAIQMMLRFNDWIRVGYDFVILADYVSFMLKLLLAFGLAFELPVVVLALCSMGLVSSRGLREKRRHVIVGLMVVAMLLTPQDPLTMLMMGIPLCLLYEGCIWMIWYSEKQASARL